MSAQRFDISIEVAIDDDGASVDPGTQRLVALAATVMAGEDVAPGTGLAILITGDDEVRELNHRFLGIDAPTDVLSFPEVDDEFIEAVTGEPHLGDIAISLPTAARQAAELGHGLDAELDHLLVHGILHLCGYDHVDDPEAETRMRGREEHYLGGAGHVHHG